MALPKERRRRQREMAGGKLFGVLGSMLIKAYLWVCSFFLGSEDVMWSWQLLIPNVLFDSSFMFYCCCCFDLTHFLLTLDGFSNIFLLHSSNVVYCSSFSWSARMTGLEASDEDRRLWRRSQSVVSGVRRLTRWLRARSWVC